MDSTSNAASTGLRPFSRSTTKLITTSPPGGPLSTPLGQGGEDRFRPKPGIRNGVGASRGRPFVGQHLWRGVGSGLRPLRCSRGWATTPLVCCSRVIALPLLTSTHRNALTLFVCGYEVEPAIPATWAILPAPVECAEVSPSMRVCSAPIPSLDSSPGQMNYVRWRPAKRMNDGDVAVCRQVEACSNPMSPVPRVDLDLAPANRLRHG